MSVSYSLAKPRFYRSCSPLELLDALEIEPNDIQYDAFTTIYFDRATHCFYRRARAMPLRKRYSTARRAGVEHLSAMPQR